MQRRAARLGGGDQGRLGFVLDGDDGDGAALRVRGLEDQAREPAVAGDQPERERLGATRYSSATTASSARRVSVRRSTTPREDVRMKSTR